VPGQNRRIFSVSRHSRRRIPHPNRIWRDRPQESDDVDGKIIQQILDELFLSFENSETQVASLVLCLKDQGIVTEEMLAPFLEQAGNASNVRWRAARLRMGSLISSAMKSAEPKEEQKNTPPQQNNPEPTADTEGNSVPEQRVDEKSKPGKSVKSDKTGEEPVETSSKNQDQAAQTKASHAK
jgi:hypothetical protein